MFTNCRSGNFRTFESENGSSSPIHNSNGPNEDPCGPPQVNGKSEDLLPPKITVSIIRTTSAQTLQGCLKKEEEAQHNLIPQYSNKIM